MLLEVLRRGASSAPEQPVVISERQGLALSYGEAVSRSEAIAADLLDRGIQRFGCAADDAADVLVLLAGSSAAGVEACVYPREISAEAVGELAQRLDHEVVVSRRPLELEGVTTVHPDELGAEARESEEPESSPVLILTTGTTNAPKGVRHEWARLVKAVKRPDEASGARWLLAYNLNQFGGIQVLLHVLASRATLVAPPTSQARDVIETMRDSKVTHVSATPTFWRVLVGGLDAETAAQFSLEQITLGGEAVPSVLLERLSALFPDTRISQVYGATEFGTVISVNDGLPGLPGSVLEPHEGREPRMRIVEGELQIRPTVGMVGYHGGEVATGDWMKTGDLVQEKDGRVHFVGRTSEIINVGGAKVHPLPIEDLAGSVDGVEFVVAYGRPNPLTGQIVALDVVAREGADTVALEAAIHEACQALTRASRPRRIRFVDELDVQQSKVRRPG